MKKKAVLLILVLLFVIFLSACDCRHEWEEATCLKPRTCAECGETQGEASGHSWQEANCETPKTCSLCGETEAEAPGHTLQEATCESPAVCSVCGETQGEKLSHGFTKWKPNGEEMTRFCKTCELEESAPLDNQEIVKEMLLGEWASRTIRIISYEEDRTIIQTGYSICFQEDGTYVFQEEQTWTGTWELVKVNLPYYTIEMYCNEKMQQTEKENDYICAIELWENYEEVHMMEYENGSQKRYLFIRDDAQDQKEAAEQLVGTWTSELIGRMNASNTQESRVIETGYTVTAQENGEVTISIEEEIKGTWVYSGKCVENEGTHNERTQYLYSVIWEGSGDVITITVSSDKKLEFIRRKDNFSYYYYFGQKTAEEMEQFIKGPELLPGEWKSTLVEKYDQQTDLWVPSEKKYVLNLTDEGKYTSNIPGIANGSWAYDGYDPEKGYDYLFMPNIFRNLWYGVTIQDGKVEIPFREGSDHFYIYMEKGG